MQQLDEFILRYPCSKYLRLLNRHVRARPKGMNPNFVPFLFIVIDSSSTVNGWSAMTSTMHSSKKGRRSALVDRDCRCSIWNGPIAFLAARILCTGTLVIDLRPNRVSCSGDSWISNCSPLSSDVVSSSVGCSSSCSRRRGDGFSCCC